MKNIELKNFAGTLKKGELLTYKKIVITYVGLAISTIIPIVSLGVIITISLGVMTWNLNIIIALICFNFFGLLLFLAILLSLLKYYNIKKTIKKCLTECEKTIATVRRVDIADAAYQPYQVEFVFVIKGKTYHKLSPRNNLFIGYNKYFLKLVNKQVPILYSEKYNEVIILNTSNI